MNRARKKGTALKIASETWTRVGLCFAGAYLLVRSVFVHVDGYPPEAQIAEYIKKKAFGGFPWQFFVCVIGILILTISGVIVQKQVKEEGAKQEEEAEALALGEQYLDGEDGFGIPPN